MFGPGFAYRGGGSRPLHVILFTFEDNNSAVEFVLNASLAVEDHSFFVVGAFLKMREVIFSSRFANEGLVSRKIKLAANVGHDCQALISAELYPASAPPTTAWTLVDDFGGAEDDALRECFLEKALSERYWRYGGPVTMVARGAPPRSGARCQCCRSRRDTT
jgi:hypothetical protein